jgi:hypothetical protein
LAVAIVSAVANAVVITVHGIGHRVKDEGPCVGGSQYGALQFLMID